MDIRKGYTNLIQVSVADGQGSQKRARTPRICKEKLLFQIIRGSGNGKALIAPSLSYRVKPPNFITHTDSHHETRHHENFHKPSSCRAQPSDLQKVYNYTLILSLMNMQKKHLGVFLCYFCH